MNKNKITKLAVRIALCLIIINVSIVCVKSHKRMSKRIKDISKENEDISKKIKEISDKLEMNGYMLTIGNDITKLPKAKGDLRLAQRTSIAVLKKFDEIAKKHNIVYWLDWGTLLGAVRHNGFIPWDDNIDIAMEREEYERIIPILEKEFDKDGFRVKVSGIIQLLYKDTPAHFDIFPFDKGYSIDLIGEEREVFIKKLKSIVDKNRKDIIENKINKINLSVKENRDNLYKMRDSVLLNNKKPVGNGFLFYGVETFCCNSGRSGMLYKHSDIFPLRKIKFEGMEFYAPNNTDYYLRSLYDDYMSYPKKIAVKHSSSTIKKLKKEESYRNSLELIRMYNVSE